MGRNAIPKLNEWRDGKHYRFRCVGDGRKPDDGPLWPRPDDGRIIVYEVETGPPPGRVEVLGTAYADSFQQVMAAMWAAGYRKGLERGRAEKQAEMRAVLGIGGASLPASPISEGG